MIFNFLTLDLIEKFLGVEIGFIAFLIFSIFGHRLTLKTLIKYRLYIQKKFTQAILRALKNGHPFTKKEISNFKIHKQLLILSLEHLLKEDPKLSLKPLEKTLFLPVLHHFCDKRLDSFFWERRNWAVRAFELFPDTATESQVLKLLDDSSFLNQKMGADLAIRHGYEKALEKILYKLQDLHVYGHYYYLNLFTHADKKLIEKIKEISDKKSEMEYLASSLWILTIRKDVNDFPQIVRFFESPRVKYRLAALGYVKTHPNKEYLPHLLQLADCEEISIIKALIQIFENYEEKKVETTLTKWLDHPSLEVQSASAFCLYKKGIKNHPLQKPFIPYFEKFYA